MLADAHSASGHGAIDAWQAGATGQELHQQQQHQRQLLTLSSPAPTLQTVPPSVNEIIESKLAVYRKSLPNPSTTLDDTLRFLYREVLTLKRRLDLDMPELDARKNTLGEADRLYGNFSQLLTGAGRSLSVASQLSALLGVVQQFNPLKYARIRTAYPVMRRAVAAYIVQLYVNGHRFSREEQVLVDAIAERLHKLHRLGAQSKRITEFFHVSTWDYGCMHPRYGRARVCVCPPAS